MRLSRRPVITTIAIGVRARVAPARIVDAPDHAEPVGETAANLDAEAPGAMLVRHGAVAPSRRDLGADAELGRAQLHDVRIARPGLPPGSS